MFSKDTPGSRPDGLTRTQDDFKPLPPGHLSKGQSSYTCSLCGTSYRKRFYLVEGSDILHHHVISCQCGHDGVKYDIAENIPETKPNITAIFKQWDMLSGFNGSLDQCKREPAETAKLIDNLKLYVKRHRPGGKGICFIGFAGRGKTHMALCTLKEIDNPSTIAVKSVDLLNRLRKSYQNKEYDQELLIMSALKNADLLLIDDIGSEKVTGWVKEKLYEIIDTRHGKKTTFFTTDKQGAEMERTLGQAITSRIYGVGYTVEVKGPDRRMAAQVNFDDVGQEVSELEMEGR